MLIPSIFPPFPTGSTIYLLVMLKQRAPASDLGSSGTSQYGSSTEGSTGWTGQGKGSDEDISSCSNLGSPLIGISELLKYGTDSWKITSLLTCKFLDLGS